MGQQNCCGCRNRDDVASGGARKNARMTAGGDEVLYFQPSTHDDIERPAGYTHYYQESTLPTPSAYQPPSKGSSLYQPSVRSYGSTVYRPMESRQMNSGVLVSYIKGQAGAEDDSE